MNEKYMKFVRMMCLPIVIAGAISCLAISARAYNHPCIPATVEDLDTIKASLNQEPWKSGYASLTNASTSQLTWPMEGPWGTVSRTPDINLTYWKNDMTAVYNLARMWYFTGNTNYAQKAHDILLAWANTHTNFAGQEMGLSLGDYAAAYVGGADILRGTWPGWTEADTTAVKNYFLNVTWPATIAGFNTTGPANKGMLSQEAGLAVAVFLDDTNKFNHVIDVYRTSPASGLFNTLPTGEMGETGRDAGHAFGTLLGMAFLSEVAWKQGVDLYSDLDNRLLACGEYYARNTFVLDNPFVPFGSIDYTYYANNAGPYGANRSALYLIQNAYKNRKGLPTPWIDRKLGEQGVDSGNFMYAKTADFSTATTPAAIVRPAVSLASSGLTLTTLGTQTAGRSVSYANGVWTMSGLGGGTWTDGADDCQFAYQAMTGDCALVGRVTSSTYSGSQNGKTGLMIRDNLIGTISQRAWIGIVATATNLMESYQTGWTENWGGSNWRRRSNPLPPGMPYWLKIERRGNLISTYTSQDGASWSAITSSYYGNLPSTVYIGLFICSGNETPNTATFENLAFTGGSGGLVTTPAAPADVLAVGSSKAITVRWLPSFGATAYDLLRSTTSGSGYAVIASNLSASTTSYVDTSVGTNTTYYYVVQAKNSAGTSGNSPQFGDSLLPTPMVNLGFSGTSTASFNSGSGLEGSDKAFDRDPVSKWYGWNAPTGWLQYDFGAGNEQVVKRYSVSSADVATRDPQSWNFLASQDGVSWTTLDSQSGQFFANRMQQNMYNLGNITAYRYYRLDITANNGAGGVAVSELGLWSDTGRTIPDGRYRIANRRSNKVIDVSGGSTANGAQLVQWTYTGGNSQQWDIAWQGNGQYRATGVASAKVIDNGGTSTAGGNLVIQPWNGGTSQLWKIVPDSDSFYHITSANSALVADVSGGSTADGANIIQWTYSGSDNQQWMPSLASGTLPPQTPPAPTGLTATAGDAQVALSWNAATGATSYNVKRATVSGGPYTTITNVTGTSFSDTGLAASTTYYYVVSAVNANGESANSTQSSATTQAAPPPAAPTGLAATAGDAQVSLSWNASSGATSYNVKRATVSGGPYTTITNVTTASFVNTGLANGTTYHYVVSAVNANGESASSNEAGATPSCTLPSVPSGLSATAGNAQVALSWSAASGATSYNVKRATTSGGSYTTIASPATTGYTDTTAVNGTTYYYVASSVNACGESANSTEASATPSDLYGQWQFDETTGTTAADSVAGRDGTLVNGPLWVAGKLGNAVDLDGVNDHVTFPAGFISTLNDFSVAAWVNLDTIGNWSRVFDFGTGTSVNMFLTPRNGASSVVRYAITTSGGAGEQQINGTAALPTAVWTHVAVTLSGTTGVLYVNGTAVGTNSNMTLKPSSLGSTTLNYVGRSQYADPYLDGRVDDFRIYSRALSAVEVSDLANPPTPPDAPTGPIATAGDAQVSLSWTASSGATSYNVKRATVSGGPYTTIASPTGTSHTDTAAVNGTTYYYVVSAVDTSFNESANSSQVSATPSAPSIVILEQNTSGGNKADIKKNQRGAQSFRHGTAGGPSYTISKVVLRLSKDSPAPNANLNMTIGTGKNSGTVAGSSFSITPASVTDSSAGVTFMTYEINYGTPVGPLTAGTTYYINFECQSANNGKQYYVEESSSSTYANGTYFKGGSDDGKDMWFQLWGQ